MSGSDDEEDGIAEVAVVGAAAASLGRSAQKRRKGACLFRGSQHCPELLDELEALRGLQGSGGLVDLDIICQEKKIKVHKVVMAAASTFFKASFRYDSSLSFSMILGSSNLLAL